MPKLKIASNSHENQGNLLNFINIQEIKLHQN